MTYLNQFRDKENRFLEILHKKFPQLKMYILHKKHSSLTLLIRDMKEEFVAEYELREFECVAGSQNMYKIQDYNRIHHSYLGHETIRFFYLKYMGKCFENYAEDYYKNTNLACVEDEICPFN